MEIYLDYTQDISLYAHAIAQMSLVKTLIVVLYAVKQLFATLLYGPRSDKRDLMAIKVKSAIFTERERLGYCEQFLKI